MDAIKRADFELKKVRVSKEGVEAEFTARQTINQKSEKIIFTAKSPVVPHPEFIIARDALREMLLRSLGHYRIYEMAMKYLKGDQAEKVKNAFLDKYLETEITGASISGQDQLRGMIISGKAPNLMDGFSALNSPRIVFTSDKLGFEKQAEKAWELLEDETWEYVIKGKKAQLDLFDEKPKRGPGRPRKKPSLA